MFKQLALCLLLIFVSWEGCLPAHGAPSLREAYSLTWEQVATMPIGVFSAAGSVTGHQIVISGGITGAGQASALIQVYHIPSNTWRIAAALPTGRFYHTQVTLADGRVLLAGGKQGLIRARHQLIRLKDCYLFDPATDQVVALPDLPAPTEGLTSHRLPDGRVIVLGGAWASVFDPAHLKQVQRIALTHGRVHHASLLWGDHHILLVGGSGRRSMELLDLKAARSIRLPVDLPRPLDDLQLIQLPDGRVWIVGGQDSWTGDTINQTWLLTLNKQGILATCEAGPLIPTSQGMADHRIVSMGAEAALALGGESQKAYTDTELRQVLWLNLKQLQISLATPLHVAHDDTVALRAWGSIWVVGGMRRASFLGGWLNLPQPTTIVERLVLSQIRKNP